MQINNVYFTDREIDVISCILNSRGVKKIANILVISPKTVESHIQNILKKINGCSQENIIDFVEKSLQFRTIKEHYIYLLVISVFEQQLRQLSCLIRKQKLSCTIFIPKTGPKNTIIEHIIKHLKLSGFEVSIEENLKDDTYAQGLNGYFNIYFLDENNIDFLLQTNSLQLQEKNIFIVKDISVHTLILKKNVNTETKKHLLNFSSTDKYFENFFDLLKILVVDIDLNQAINNFNQLSESIHNSQGNKASSFLKNQVSKDYNDPLDLKLSAEKEDHSQSFEIQQQIADIIRDNNTIQCLENIVNDCTTQITNNINANNNSFKVRIFNKKIVQVLTSFICIITLSYIMIIKLVLRNTLVINADFPVLLDDFFSLIKNNNFSADNITPEQIHANHSLIKQVEKWFTDDIYKEKITSYFNNKEILSQELVNYLSNLHALANYYTYNEHDGQKARIILEHVKSVSENYVIIRSKIKFNFKKLSKEDVYNELSIIKDLPEIYTQILYALGRTFLYHGNINDGAVYFELSKYLGNKLHLFEGYLSVRSGLGIIAQQEIEQSLRNKYYVDIQDKILKVIELYKKLQCDNSKYTLNYKPSNLNTQTIIPTKDIYNSIECRERIIHNYAQLVLITLEVSNREKYLRELVNQFVGDNDSVEIFLQLQVLPDEKIASLYNNLGNILLQFHEESVDDSLLINYITQNLKLEAKDDLDVIEQIFRFAATHSRNTYFTKADSYDGLIKVYQIKINSKKLTTQNQKLLEDEISLLKSKRDSINKELKREFQIYN